MFLLKLQKYGCNHLNQCSSFFENFSFKIKTKRELNLSLYLADSLKPKTKPKNYLNKGRIKKPKIFLLLYWNKDQTTRITIRNTNQSNEPYILYNLFDFLGYQQKGVFDSLNQLFLQIQIKLNFSSNELRKAKFQFTTINEILDQSSSWTWEVLEQTLIQYLLNTKTKTSSPAAQNS
ncbi:unnamed protein product [Paramecium sonneborni]|uniref:Uncharacterized protein n=1 Tax=Paramecium sonneborni TaxID=65129 RepID=A0A8S1QED9_9CILI|nr:unnamed protein product [Paramecium sonneborni]